MKEQWLDGDLEHVGYAYDLVFHFGKIEERDIEINIVDYSAIIIWTLRLKTNESSCFIYLIET